MLKCCVLSCGRRRDEDNPRLTFHNLPKNKSLRQKWIDVIGSKNINLNVKKKYICSLHFEESCIYKTMNIARVRENAVPSLHLQTSPISVDSDSEVSSDRTISAGGTPEPASPNFVDINQSDTQIISIEDSDNPELDIPEFVVHKLNDKQIKSISSSEVPVKAKPKMADTKKINTRIKSVSNNRTPKPVRSKMADTKPSDTQTKSVSNNEMPEPVKLKMVDTKKSNTRVKSVSNNEMTNARRKNSALKEISYAILIGTSGEINEMVKVGLCKNTDLIDGPTQALVCRICLSIRNKLFCIRSYKLTDAFELLTGQKLNFDDGLPQNLCAECATKIQNFYKFRMSIQKSYYYMLRMQVRHKNLTEATFKNIDRKQIEEIGFTTLEKTLRIDKYDLDIKHTDLYEDVKTKNETDKISDNESEEESDVEITMFNNDTVSDLDSKNIGKVYDVDSKVSEKISDVDNEISDKLCDLVNENNDKFNDFNDEMSDLSETDRADFDDDDSLPLVGKGLVIKPKRFPKHKLVLDEKLFAISYLSYEEQLMDLEKRKEKEKYSHYPFKCTICYTAYSIQQSYDRHMLRHTDAAGEHECKICKIHFLKKRLLSSHMSSNHSQMFTCNECGYVTRKRKLAQLHEEWHKGKKYVCQHCKVEFIKYATYIAHVRIQHPSKHICQLCGYTYIGEKGLAAHKFKMHREDKFVVPEDGPVCEPCNVKFATEEAYQKHLSISHATNGKRKARNEKTPTYYNRRGVLIKDNNGTVVGVQTVKWPIPCEQCGILLADTRTYQSHFRRIHPGKVRTQYPAMRQPAMCEVCGRIFQSHTKLQAHRWIHTDVPNFKCDHCDKEFFTKVRLMSHLRIHDENSPSYCCVVCGKHFSNTSNRYRHMLLHSGQKPYKCEFCDKSFYLPSDKKTHIKYTHMKVPWPRKNKDGKNKRRRVVQSLSKPNEQEINKDNEPSIQDGYEHNGVKRRKTRADNESSGQEICENVEEQLICDNMKSEQVMDKDVESEQVIDKDVESEQVIYEDFESEQVIYDDVESEQLIYEDIESEQVIDEDETNEIEIADDNIILIVKLDDDDDECSNYLPT